MSVLHEEIFKTLEDKYLFTGLKKNVHEWCEKDILKVYNRLLNVYDPEYNSNNLDYNSKNGRRHITRYLTRMGLGYLVPKVEDIANRTKALKVITALDDRVMSKYREVAPKRVRAVVKQEQMWKLKEKKPCKGQENVQPNLQEAKSIPHLNLPEEGFIFKSKGHQLQRTPIKPPDSILSEKKETLKVPLECNQERTSSSDNLSLVRPAVPAKSNYIPCGHQIPRTPKRISVETNFENEHGDLVDSLNVKMCKKSYECENHPSQDEGNNAEKNEKITSTISPNYESDELEIFPSKVTTFIPIEVGNAQSCGQTLENSNLKEEKEYCDAVPYPKGEEVTGMETISNGDVVVGISSPFIKDKIRPIDAVQSDESYTEKNSKGSTKSSVVLDERIDPSSSHPNDSSSEEKESTPPSANSPSIVNGTSPARVSPRNHKIEQRKDSSNLPLQSLSGESDEKTFMTQKEFLIIDEKPLPITGTPDFINDSMSIRDCQKNIIPQGKQLKRTPTGPVCSKEFDKDCIVVDHSVHESSNSVLEVTKIESKLDYSLQIFVKTKKDKKTKCGPIDDVIDDRYVSLENEDKKNAIIPKQIFKMEPNTSFIEKMDEIPANNDTKEKGDHFEPEIESTDSKEKNYEERDNMQVESHNLSREETKSKYIKNCDVIVKSSYSTNEQGRSVDEVVEKDIDIEDGSLSKSPGASMELSDKEISVPCIFKSSGNIASHLATESVFDRLIGDQEDSGKVAEEFDTLFEDSFDIFPRRKQKEKDLKLYRKDGQSCSNSVKDGLGERIRKCVGNDVKTNVDSNIARTAKEDKDEKSGDNANSTHVKNLEKDDLKIPIKKTRQLRNRNQESKLNKLNKGQQQNLEKKEIVKNSVTEYNEEPKMNNRRLRSSNTSSCQKVEVKRPNNRNNLTALDLTNTEKEEGSLEKVESKPHSEESEETITVEVAPVRRGKTKTGKKMTSSSVNESAEQSNVLEKVNEKTKGFSVTNASGQLQKRAVRSRVKNKENLVEAKDDVIVPKSRGKAAVTEENENKMDKRISKKNNQSSPNHKQVPLADITSSNITKDRNNIKSKPPRTVGAKKGKRCNEEDKENSCSFMEPNINEVSLTPKSKKVSVSKKITSQNTYVSHANNGKKGKEIENSDCKETIINKKVVETNRKRSHNLKDTEDGASGAKKKRGSKPAVGKSSTSSEQSLEKVAQVEQPIENAKLLSSKDNFTSEEQIRVNCGAGKTLRKKKVGDEKKASVTCRIPKQKNISKEEEKGWTDDPESLLSCDISEIIVTSRSRKGKRNLEDSKVSLSKCGPSVTKKKNIPEELLQVEKQENNVVENKGELSIRKKVGSKERAPRIRKQSVDKTVVVNTSLMEKSVCQKVKGKQLPDKTCDDHASKNVRTSRRCKTLAVAAIKESLNSSDSFERYRKSKY